MAKKIHCELVTWAEVQRLCRRLAGLVMASGYHPDIVIAIGRGGYIPARLLCDYLDIMALTTIKVEHYLSGASRQEQAVVRYPLKADIRDLRVLLVDDVNDTGDTLDAAIQHLNTFHPAEIRTAVMHHKVTTRYTVEYYARKVIKWRWLIYPWAVYEDVAGFLGRLSPPPHSLADAQRRLGSQFDIEIKLQRLEDICTCMNIQIGQPPSTDRT